MVALQLTNVDEGSREDSPLCAHHQKRCSMVLRKMCLEHGRLPSLWMIKGELRRIGERPYRKGATADIWLGVHMGSKVAIKELRVNSTDLDLEKVRRLVSVLFENQACADESGTEIPLRSSPVETVQTPKPVTVAGGGKITINYDDDLRMDGARYYRGLRYCMSWNQSTQIGERFSEGRKQSLTNVAFSVGRRCSRVEIPPRLAVCARRPEKRMSDLGTPHPIII